MASDQDAIQGALVAARRVLRSLEEHASHPPSDGARDRRALTKRLRRLAILASGMPHCADLSVQLRAEADLIEKGPTPPELRRLMALVDMLGWRLHSPPR